MDNKVMSNDFGKIISVELRSKLYTRFIQYDLFIFSDKVATILIHLKNQSVSITLPYIIETTSDEKVYSLFYKDKEYSGSLSGLVGLMVSSSRREETKLSKFK